MTDRGRPTGSEGRRPGRREAQDPKGGPLHGIVVLDLTRALAGPYATLLLAELGARVVKIESPQGGDDARSFPPLVAGKSVYFASVNREKESIALDLKAAPDRAIFEGLLEQADVLVENFRPGVMERLGYGWDAVRMRRPDLVMASISGFGQTGPASSRTAYDMVVQAMGGLMSITGPADGEPVRVGVSIGDIAAGLFAAVGIVAALRQAEQTGVGAQVDISMLECQAALVENAIARHLATGELPGRVGARHPTLTPFGLFSASDGAFALCVGNETQFRLLAETLDRPDLAMDRRFDSMASRNAHHEDLKRELEAVFATAPRAQWLERLAQAGLPSGPLNSIADVVADPQIVARKVIIDVEDAAGPTRFVSMPVRLSTHAREAKRAAPQLDADRSAILELASLLAATSVGHAHEPS
jgi:CoA:oxalate CoA-transferase